MDYTSLKSSFLAEQTKNPMDFIYNNLYAALETEISLGTIEHRAKLNIHAISKSLDVSRTTVLKAAYLLCDSHWLDKTESGDYVVLTPTKSDLERIMIFRKTVEPAIAKYATRYATNDDIDELWYLLQQFKAISPPDENLSVSDIPKILTVENAFHGKLLEITNNPFFTSAMQINQNRINQEIRIIYTISGKHNTKFKAANYRKSSPYHMHRELNCTL